MNARDRLLSKFESALFLSDDGHATASNSLRSGGSDPAPEASAESALAASLDSTNHVVTSPNGPDTNLTSNVTSSLSSNTTTDSLTPEPKPDNGNVTLHS